MRIEPVLSTGIALQVAAVRELRYGFFGRIEFLPRETKCGTDVCLRIHPGARAPRRIRLLYETNGIDQRECVQTQSSKLHIVFKVQVVLLTTVRTPCLALTSLGNTYNHICRKVLRCRGILVQGADSAQLVFHEFVHKVLVLWCIPETRDECAD